MDIKTVLSWVSGFFSALAYVPYIYVLLKPGSTLRPNRASWFVWWLIDVSGVAALIAAGSYKAVPMFAAFSLGSIFVLILSIKRGEGGFSKLDVGCVITAVVGLGLWAISGKPLLAIIALMTAALAGTLPTIVKSWKDPRSEDLMTWILFTAGGFFGILAINKADFVNVAPPANVLFMQINILLPLVLYRVLGGRRPYVRA